MDGYASSTVVFVVSGWVGPLLPVLWLNCKTNKVPMGRGDARHFFNVDFELKASTYTLPAETLCRKLEKQGGALAFVSVLGDLCSACYLYSAC